MSNFFLRSAFILGVAEYEIFRKRDKKSSAKGHSEDALALRGDEGRGTLRKAVGRCEQPLIRGYPNGETHRMCGILT